MTDADFNLFPAPPVRSTTPPVRDRTPDLRGPERHARLTRIDRKLRAMRGRDES